MVNFNCFTKGNFMRRLITVQNIINVFSIILMCFYIVLFIRFLVLDIISMEKSQSPFGIDFAAYYTAGQMVTSGSADYIYNVPEHHAALEKVLNRNIPFLLSWVYPPAFLLVIVPFSFLPYYLALTLWLVITLALTIFMVFLLVPKHKNIALLVCGFPGILMNLRWGQNGFLNTVLLGFGIYFVEANPVMSGLMFGLLTYKPQIVCFPLLLLLISKKWKVLAWTTFFAAFSAMSSGVIFGFETWIRFINSFFYSSNALLATNWKSLSAIQPSFLTAFRLLGMSNFFSYLLLAIIGVTVIFAAWWVWRITERLPLKGTVLVLGILLTMPYYMQYDLMILSIPLVLLAYDCLEYGYCKYEIAILTILWIMPLINWPLVFFTKVQICPFILFAVLLMTLNRVVQESRKSKYYYNFLPLDK